MCRPCRMLRRALSVGLYRLSRLFRLFHLFQLFWRFRWQRFIRLMCFVTVVPKKSENGSVPNVVPVVRMDRFEPNDPEIAIVRADGPAGGRPASAPGEPRVSSGRAASGRAASGRAASGRAASGRAASGRPAGGRAASGQRVSRTGGQRRPRVSPGWPAGELF